MLDTRLMLVNGVLRNRKKTAQGLWDASPTFEAFIHERQIHENMSKPPEALKKYFDLTTFDINGCPLYVFKNKSVEDSKTMFYLHGGAYVTGPYKEHWLAVSDIARKSNLNWMVFDYPTYPEGNALKILELTVEAYMKALEINRELILIGDSAGGSLCLLLLNALELADTILPKKMVLLSPWVDVSMTNPAIKGYEASDAMLNTDFLMACGKGFAGELNVKDPEVSPTYHQYHDLVPTRLYVSDHELLYPDCLSLYERLERKGLPITLHTGHRMPHGWPILPIIKQAKDTRDEISEWLKEEKDERESKRECKSKN